MGPKRSPETSVRNHPSLRIIQEDDRIQVNRSRSLRSRNFVFVSVDLLLELLKEFSCFYENWPERYVTERHPNAVGVMFAATIKNNTVTAVNLRWDEH
jgi:hypothetical protein